MVECQSIAATLLERNPRFQVKRENPKYIVLFPSKEREAENIFFGDKSRKDVFLSVFLAINSTFISIKN